jgi:hypothetical protein
VKFRYLIALLFLTVPGYALALDPFDPLFKTLSSGAYFVTGGKACQNFDDTRAENALHKLRPACLHFARNTKLGFVDSVVDAFNDHVEDDYFATLAVQYSPELKCAASYAAALPKNSAWLDAITAKLLQLQDYKSQQKALRKICPYSLDSLNASDRKEDVEVCTKKIGLRMAIDDLRISIPLSGAPEIEKLLNSDLPMDSRLIRGKVATAFAAASTTLNSQAANLLKLATTEGGKAFPRDVRIALVSDPMIVKRMLDRAGGNRDLKAVSCRVDAQYGSGEVSREKIGGSLGVLSLFIPPPLKIGAYALDAVEGASLARQAGLFSMRAARILQYTVTYGANAVSLAGNVERGCLKTGKYIPVKAGACQAAPSTEEMKTDNCFLMSALATVGIAAPFLSRLGSGEAKALTAEARAVEKTRREPGSNVAYRLGEEPHAEEDILAAKSLVKRQLLNDAEMRALVDHQDTSVIFKLWEDGKITDKEFATLEKAFHGVAVGPPLAAVKVVSFVARKAVLPTEVGLQRRQALEDGESLAVIDPKNQRPIGYIEYQVKNQIFYLISTDVSKTFQENGYFDLMFSHVLIEHPDVRSIVSMMSGTNQEILEKGIRAGKSVEEALKNTPAYRTRMKLGFTEMRVERKVIRDRNGHETVITNLYASKPNVEVTAPSVPTLAKIPVNLAKNGLPHFDVAVKGQHGGAVFPLQREPGTEWAYLKHSDPTFTGYVTTIQHSIGTKLLNNLGLKIESENRLLLPNATESNLGVAEFNKGLPQPDKITITYYKPPGGIVHNEGFVTKYALKKQLPMSEELEEGLHDRFAHLGAGTLPNWASDLLQAQSKALVDFKAFLQARHPEVLNDARANSLIDQAFTSRSQAIDSLTTMPSVFKKNASAISSQGFLSTVKRNLSNGASPMDLLIHDMSDGSASAAFRRALNEFIKSERNGASFTTSHPESQLQHFEAELGARIDMLRQHAGDPPLAAEESGSWH